MKKFTVRMAMLPALLLLLLLPSGCAQENVVFTGKIEKVGVNSILVVTEDLNAADRASVGYDKKLRLDFTPEVGQTVRITILPEIRESYPVQVTAVKIELLPDAPAYAAQSEEDEDEKMNEIKSAYQKITPDEYLDILDADNDVVLVDVRTAEEYAEGHITDAVLLTDSEIPEKAGSVLPDKDRTIVLYCRSGRRSAASAEVLIGMGYTSVFDLGGIIDWPYEVVK